MEGEEVDKVGVIDRSKEGEIYGVEGGEIDCGGGGRGRWGWKGEG